MEIEEELQEEANGQGNKTNYLQQARAWFKGMDFNALLTMDNLLKNAPFVFFLFLLTLIYIGNTHEMENTTRDIDRLKDELKEVRWQYMSAKAELMYNCKMTEVATAVEPLGLKELTSPPKKIVIEKGEY